MMQTRIIGRVRQKLFYPFRFLQSTSDVVGMEMRDKLLSHLKHAIAYHFF